MLRGGGSLSGHLKLSNLSFRQTTIVVVVVIRAGIGIRVGALLLRLGFGLLRRRYYGYVYGAGGLGVLATEVNTGGCWGDFALGFEEARLEVDDVVAQLVVFGLEGFV